MNEATAMCLEISELHQAAGETPLEKCKFEEPINITHLSVVTLYSFLKRDVTVSFLT